MTMFKDTLATAQPVVYQTLVHALRQHRLSHSYLFVGPKGTLKQQTARFLAQSLVCEHPDENGLACEQCFSCLRVSQNNYFDVVCIDGRQDLIKIDPILALHTQFEKTALEQAGQKVFIIDGCDNMTAKAANSLLKFIEEPTPNLTGIFITTRPDRVLTTIVSRCQVLSFNALSKTAFYQQAANLGLDPLNCHLISGIVHEISEIETLKDLPAYTLAIQYFVEFMNYYLTDFSQSIFYLQSTAFKTSNLKTADRKADRECFQYFLEIATIFVHDYTNHAKIGDDSWDGLLESSRTNQLDAELLLRAVTQTRDDLLSAGSNMLLLLDAMLYTLAGGQKQ